MGLVTSLSNVFEAMLGDIDYDLNSDRGKLYPFKVRCGVVRRRPPRHEFFEYFLDFGRGYIDDVFTGKPLPKYLAFVFPERWLGVAEQQAFTHILSQHPCAEYIEMVDIITSSPLVVSSFHREMIRILSWEDDEKYGCGNGA